MPTAPTTTVAPLDYGELWTDYHEYVERLVLKFGIDAEMAEDVTMTVLTKFIALGFLEKYDPEAQFETSRGVRRTSFRGFLSGFVARYVLQELDKQGTLHRKVPTRLEEPAGSQDGTPATWFELNAPPHLDREVEELEQLDEVQRALAYLESLPVRGTRDLAFVFQELRRQIALTGKTSRAEIAAKMGISETAMCLIFKDLRAALMDIGLGPRGTVA